MNPSYNSGSSTSGVKPGVIASLPEQPAPDLPQPMKLSDGTRGGSRKGILVIGILAVLLIVGVIVGLVMGVGSGNSGNTATGDQKYFLEYANFLLNGVEDVNNDIGDFDENEEYAATTAYLDGNKGFFNKAQELWKAFYEKYINEENEADISQTVGDIRYQDQLMDFAVRYMNTPEMEDDELLKLYLKDGLDNAKMQVDNYYKNLLDTTFEPGKEYATTLINHAKNGLNLCSIFDSNGCIENGEINTTCIEKKDTTMVTAQAEYSEEDLDINNALISRVVSELEEFCFKINDDFGGEDE